MPDLDEAIAEATEQLTKEGGGTVETPPEESTEENPEDSVETSESDELNEDQVKEAKILYKALLDPNQRVDIVAALAARSGLLNEKTPLETPKEVAKVEKGIATIIKEALPEFPGLADKLAPAIEQIVQEERNQREASMQEIHAQNVQNEVDSELTILARETKGESRKLENKMAQLMTEVSPGPNVSVKSYIRNLYALASVGTTKQKTSAQIADKINRNAANAPDRIKAGAGTARTGTLPPKKMNLNDSIKWAIDQASKGVTKV